MLRIVPLYFVLTAACFALTDWHFSADRESPEMACGATKLELAVLLAIDPVHTRSEFIEPDLNPLIPQGWTLNYEVMFYILFSASLFLAAALGCACADAALLGNRAG